MAEDEQKESDLWATPDEVFNELNERYGPFDLDAAANFQNHKCRFWLGPSSMIAEDCLTTAWNFVAGHGRITRVFMNPPYSNPAPFVAKAWNEAHIGHCMVTMLLPSTTEVGWWKEFVYDGDRRRFRPGVEVEFWPNRIRHIRPDGTRGGSPKFGSVVVTFYGGL